MTYQKAIPSLADLTEHAVISYFHLTPEQEPERKAVIFMFHCIKDELPPTHDLSRREDVIKYTIEALEFRFSLLNHFEDSFFRTNEEYDREALVLACLCGQNLLPGPFYDEEGEMELRDVFHEAHDLPSAFRLEPGLLERAQNLVKAANQFMVNPTPHLRPISPEIRLTACINALSYLENFPELSEELDDRTVENIAQIDFANMQLLAKKNSEMGHALAEMVAWARKSIPARSNQTSAQILAFPKGGPQ